MKPLVLILIAALYFAPVAAAQKRKQPTSKKPATKKLAPAASKTTARIIGSSVFIVTKNGDRISGELLDLTAYSARIRSEQLESTIALDTIERISFGAPDDQRARSVQTLPRAEFIRDAEALLTQFDALASGLESGIDYTDYGRQLTELRRWVDRFTARYAASQNSLESRVLALLAGAFTNYSWARTIWTLKFGRSSDGTVSESDSPLLADVVALYPDVKSSAASASKLSVDKLVGGLWKVAADNVDGARSLVASPR